MKETRWTQFAPSHMEGEVQVYGMVLAQKRCNTQATKAEAEAELASWLADKEFVRIMALSNINLDDVHVGPVECFEGLAPIKRTRTL